VSPKVGGELPKDVRAALLEEIRDYLPAFLRRDATEQHDPVGDVRELLGLDEGDLERVVAVHGCLDPAVIAFGEQLHEGIRNPITASTRPAEVGQAVRGPVDWSATVARRSLQGGDPSCFVVRSARKAFDVPENQVLVWLLNRLHLATSRAEPGRATASGAESSWTRRIAELKTRVDDARRFDWLKGVEPAVPIASTMRRLKAARNGFYRNHVVAAAEATMALENPSDEALVDLLCRRYFEPAHDWTIFEVCVALRLAREFARTSGRPRKARLMVGSGGVPFARYGYAGGAEVSLILQKWPADLGPSMLQETTKRQGLGAAPSRPDLLIVRSGPEPDVAVLELKASYRASYLREGLSKLLGYLAERPEIWVRQPSGWLVAPPSAVFEDRTTDGESSLWLVSSDRVAKAAVARFAPSESESE
jgi:hypothetical protein